MSMTNDDIITPHRSRPKQPNRGRAAGRGPVIDQEGREIPDASLRSQFEGFQFDFAHSSSGWRGSMRWQSCWTSPSSCPAPKSVTASTG
jgi:hypothetical protein